jgi:N,N-dimethylformamidase beta subunit-like protein
MRAQGRMRSSLILLLCLLGLMLSGIPETSLNLVLSGSDNSASNNGKVEKEDDQRITVKDMLEDPSSKSIITNSSSYDRQLEKLDNLRPTLKNITNNISNRDVTSDTSLPELSIINPNGCSPLLTGNVLVNGSAHDNQSGIDLVEVQVDDYEYSEAKPQTEGNWTLWSISVHIQDTKPHRIVSRATDHAGNANWAEVTINSIPFNKMPEYRNMLGQNENISIAFVEPIFTTASYANHFYTFYAKYDTVPKGQKVTTDLDYFTAQIPSKTDRDYFLNFTEKVREFAPGGTVEIIDDRDVHAASIFKPGGENLYDVLLLLHNEYVTQNEYDNFRRFVSNGGTIVLLDSNIFYAEIKYDPEKCETSLVHGHDWKFDGRSAMKSVHEGFYNESKEWVGGNFLYADIEDAVLFANNPFNYTHFEENYVNNPNATIMLDYKAQLPTLVVKDNDVGVPLKIATYELKYGEGKVIMMGLYSQNLFENTKFISYFQDIILPRAVGQEHEYKSPSGREHLLYSWLNTGKVSDIKFDQNSSSILLSLDRSDQRQDKLHFLIPNTIVSSNSTEADIGVTVNGMPIEVEESSDDLQTGLTIPLTIESATVSISNITYN